MPAPARRRTLKPGGNAILLVGLICPDCELGDVFQQGLSEIRHIALVKRLDAYPNTSSLVRFLRAQAPQIIFLSVEKPGTAIELAAEIESQAPGTQIVAINRTSEQALLLALMRAGIREFLSLPLSDSALRTTLLRLSDLLERKPVRNPSADKLFAFLPAKAGVGASTIALNSAFAFSRLPDTRVLLIDLDLNCGMIGFMLKMTSQFSILDAAEHAAELDEDLWPKLVSTADHLDVLPSGTLSPGFRIEPAQIHYLLDFARRNYNVICVDLSGMMEKYSLEVMQEARQIFIVSTQEVPPLHLGREKLNLLRNLDLIDRVRILLNRYDKRQALTDEQVQELLGLPITATFPNDYLGVHRSITEARPVDAASKLGKCFAEFARLSFTGKAAPAQLKRHFIDYFNIIPARYRTE